MKTTLSREGAATPSKKDRFDKKNVNVRVNPFINFQIGIIAALLLAFVIIEITTEQVEIKKNPISIIAIDDSDWNPVIFRSVPDNPPVEVAVIKPNIEMPPKVVDDNTPIPEPVIDPEPVVQPVVPVDVQPADSKPIIASPVATVTAKPQPAKPITTTMDGLDSMPLFPGCESLDNNAERKKCFNDKMQRFVSRKFDTGLANELDLEEGEIVKIDILFTINEKGLPVDVQVRTPHALLEKEAYRLIGKLPRITPGKVKGNPVSIYFHLPIKFRVQD